MARQLAIDFCRDRIRAVEIDGNARNPKIRAFGSIELDAADGDEVGAVGDLLRSQKFVRDPAAIALGSQDVTFRELDLPFSSDEQIQKVIKYEAESHLHLVDIDDVVIDYRQLRVSRDGSHLLVMAVEKVVLEDRVSSLERNGADPFFVDLHLTAVFEALASTGYLLPPDDGEEGEEEEAAATAGEATLILECDWDVTHLIVARGSEMVSARAIRVGVGDTPPPPRTEEPAADAPPPVEDEGAAAGDVEYVLVDDHDTGMARTAFFKRLRREVQRTLFPLGLAEERLRVLLLGPLVRQPEFVEQVATELGADVEVARPFDQLDHDLDPEIAELANAEGAAALGVALRMVGAAESRLDFRQEELRYSKRFDQLKVALSFACIAALVVALLFAGSTYVKWKSVKNQDHVNALQLAINVHKDFNHEEAQKISAEFNSSKDAYRAMTRIKNDMNKIRNGLRTELGRDGDIQAVPSGLDVIKEMFEAYDAAIDSVGRLEINDMKFNLATQPVVEIQGIVNESGAMDGLIKALRRSPIVTNVEQSRIEATKDGTRTIFKQLRVTLKPEFAVYQRRGR